MKSNNHKGGMIRLPVRFGNKQVHLTARSDFPPAKLHSFSSCRLYRSSFIFSAASLLSVLNSPSNFVLVKYVRV
jgi:hypothetical protein